MSNNPPPAPLNIIRRVEVQRRLGIARSTLYAYLDSKSAQYKPAFPRPVRLGATTGFVEHEINQYVLGLMQAREGLQR